MSTENADVIIVGAGFCGLSAALELVGQGLDVIVLEARDRVGGRVESLVNGRGERIDLGGQFLCDDMPELSALVDRFGMRRIATPTDGAFVVQPPTRQEQAVRDYQGMVELRERMNRLDPRNAQIADMSVAAWLAQQPDDAGAKSGFRSLVEGLWCVAIDRVPLWYLVDNDQRVTNEISELQFFLADTMHALSERLAAELGDRLRLGAPAEAIEIRTDGVSVISAGRRLHAKGVILATPPVMARKIAYHPSLPGDLVKALDAWHSGSVIKALVRYETPFWRTAGRSGTVMWRDIHGLFACDASTDDEHAALVVFVGGPLAEQWAAMAAERIKAEMLRRLAAALGPEAAKAIDVTMRDWVEDRWSGGGYSDVVVDLGASDAEAVLIAGMPRLAFACSELSPSFPGYIEGAIVAGRDAARRCVAGLGKGH